MNYIPCVQKESSMGIQCVPITDELLLHRVVQLDDAIDAATASIINGQIRHLAAAGPGQPITLLINSPGGEISSGLAIVDTIRLCGCPVIGVCTGVAASMAAIIFEACSKRQMLPHAEIMIHDPATTGGGGTALSVADQCRRLMDKRDLLADILAERTGFNRSQIQLMTEKDFWISAQRAVKENFADEILTSL